jgi:hypothetical protein
LLYDRAWRDSWLDAQGGHQAALETTFRLLSQARHDRDLGGRPSQNVFEYSDALFRIDQLDAATC